MELGEGGKGVAAAGGGDGAGRVVDGGRGSLREGDAGLVREVIEAAEELGAGEEGGGGDSGVALGAGHLDEVEGAAVFEEGVTDEGFVAELVGDGGGGVGHALGDVLDGAGVGPGEEAVDVAELRVELVVAAGHDDDDLVGECAGDLCGGSRRAGIGEVLAVLHAELGEDGPLRGGDADGGDDEGAEVVALAALVAADPGGGAVDDGGDGGAGGLLLGGGGSGAAEEGGDGGGAGVIGLVEDDFAAAVFRGVEVEAEGLCGGGRALRGEADAFAVLEGEPSTVREWPAAYAAMAARVVVAVAGMVMLLGAMVGW